MTTDSETSVNDSAHTLATPKRAVRVQLENVTKSFRGGRDTVLRGVNIDFPPGKLTYILGSSGAGKSVLLKHIMGLLRPDSGKVWVDGKDMAVIDGQELSKHRLLFGTVFQNSALFDDMTVFDNVAFPLREHTSLSEEEIFESVTRTLSVLGMTSGYLKFPNEISGGMKKRVGFARAVVREPSVLLYDEPTTGLDPVTRTTVDDLIAQMKQKYQVTSIVISHDIPSALLLADYIVFLHQGQFVFKGNADEFRRCEHEAIRCFLNAEQRTVDALQVRVDHKK